MTGGSIRQTAGKRRAFSAWWVGGGEGQMFVSVKRERVPIKIVLEAVCEFLMNVEFSTSRGAAVGVCKG
jgi:hypothetical protein